MRYAVLDGAVGELQQRGLDVLTLKDGNFHVLQNPSDKPSDGE